MPPRSASSSHLLDDLHDVNSEKAADDELDREQYTREEEGRGLVQVVHVITISPDPTFPWRFADSDERNPRIDRMTRVLSGESTLGGVAPRFESCNAGSVAGSSCV